MHARCVMSWSGFASPNGASTIVGDRAASAGASASTSAPGATGRSPGVYVCSTNSRCTGIASRTASAASSSCRRVSITSSPGAKPDCTSHLRIGLVGYSGGLPANTVTTDAPGCAAMKFAQPRTASSRCGDTMTTRSSSPAWGTPHSRNGASSPKLLRSTMRVQPGVDPLGLLVDRAKLAEQLVVDRAVGPLGVEGIDDADAA